MNLSPNEARNLIQQALCLLRSQDSYLLEIGGNERTAAGRVACYLERLLLTSTYIPRDFSSELTVDIEYNRHGDDIKKCDADNIIPDLTIHKRGTDDQNLAVMEFKRYGNKAHRKAGDANDDDRKLKRLTETLGDYGYKYGFFVEIPSDENASAMPFKITLYEDGKPIETYEV